MPKSSPPLFSIKLITWLCKDELVEEIEGNLLEFYEIAKAEKRSFLLLRYWYEVFLYFRPSLLQTFKFKINSPMYPFNPKIAIRNLVKNKSTSVISLLSFIFGLTSVIFLYFYIDTEINYDAFHEEKDQIFKVYRTSQDQNGEVYDIGVSSGPYARALQNDFPETILSTVRTSMRDLVVSNGENRFYEDYVLVADTNFFEFFSYDLKYGDPATVLDETANVVLSERLAKKYFGEENPIGKSILLNGQEGFIVAGIFSKPLNKTHLEFDMVLSMAMYEPAEWFHDWWNNFAFTFVKINPSNERYLEQQFEGFMNKYLGTDFEKNNNRNGLKLVSLNELYFHDARYDAKKGNKASLFILGSVAIAILFIACFNYINLSIAQSFKRAKEVGIRKILGVKRKYLIGQFMSESIILLIIAMVISFVLSIYLKDTLNSFFGLDVEYRWGDQKIRYFFAGLFGLIILAAGLYPAVLLSSFNSLKVLKNNNIRLGKNILVRKGLIIAQFAISVFLVIVTLLIYTQLDFINNKELGYNGESILVIDTDPEIRENYEPFRDRIRQLAEIKHVTIGSGVPSGFHDSFGLRFSGNEDQVRVNTVFSDIFYLKTFNIEILHGRDFNESLTSDNEAMMINESAWKATGLALEEIIGKKVHIPFREFDRTIIGIYKDYHFKDLRDKVGPQAIIIHQDMRRIAIKMNSNDLSSTVAQIEDIYRELAPNFPMKSWLLEDDLIRHYESENQQARVFTMFSGLSISLTCMGIFGLAAFSARQRQKELSIRKVLGASVQQVIFLISREFLLLMLISVIVAIPVSWYFMSQWLQDFAYRITLENYWVLFVTGGAVIGLIAYLTIALKALKAATNNPAEIMRYE